MCFFIHFLYSLCFGSFSSFYISNVFFSFVFYYFFLFSFILFYVVIRILCLLFVFFCPLSLYFFLLLFQLIFILIWFFMINRGWSLVSKGKRVTFEMIKIDWTRRLCFCNNLESSFGYVFNVNFLTFLPRQICIDCFVNAIRMIPQLLHLEQLLFLGMSFVCIRSVQLLKKYKHNHSFWVCNNHLEWPYIIWQWNIKTHDLVHYNM